MQINNLQEYAGALVSEFLSHGFQVSIQKAGETSLRICANAKGIEHTCSVIDTTHLSVSSNPKSIAQYDANELINKLKTQGA